MKYSERSQDIHKNDREIWQKFKNSWDRFQYANALNQLQNEQFDTKKIVAETINNITTKIVSVEETIKPQDKPDIIKVSTDPPINIKTGDVWFQITGGEIAKAYTFDEVTALNKTFADIDKLGLTWAQADEGFTKIAIISLL